MAIRYAGFTSTSPQVAMSAVIPAASGGTLAGGQCVQVVFDDAVFTSAPEGRQRLLTALRIICDRLQVAKVWPLSVNS